MISMTQTANPFLTINYEPALERLGNDYYDLVAAAEFPQHILRWRNDRLLLKIGLDPQTVTDEHFIAAFGQFQGVRPFLALRYHGYQFGEYNSRLGDGRGFLYGQVRGIDGELYDFGTKGSGTTPYSRSADGRLTLKGGVREVLAAEALEQMGVRTSSCLSMIETGESLWRGDEPSPTRSSVMVRFSRSHIRFGTFERLSYFKRQDLIQKLLDHVIAYYYPTLTKNQSPENFQGDREIYAQFYSELVQKIAELVAQWMAAGFCHAVLNTDNMSITGESFDYGPYAFIPTYNLQFTAAYFDYYGRYCYGNQPEICKLNLEMLQRPLAGIIDQTEMNHALNRFDDYYHAAYRQQMLKKLGFGDLPIAEAEKLLNLTIRILSNTQIGYHDFFYAIREQFNHHWRDDPSKILSEAEPRELIVPWCEFYYHLLQTVSTDELTEIAKRLRTHNPKTVLLRPQIEAIWEPIVKEDNWQPFYDLINQIQSGN